MLDSVDRAWQGKAGLQKMIEAIRMGQKVFTPVPTPTNQLILLGIFTVLAADQDADSWEQVEEGEPPAPAWQEEEHQWSVRVEAWCHQYQKPSQIVDFEEQLARLEEKVEDDGERGGQARRQGRNDGDERVLQAVRSAAKAEGDDDLWAVERSNSRIS